VLDLTGRAAIVTGAGSVGPGWGNGKATAVLLARQGAAVFCIDNNPEAVAETFTSLSGLIEEKGLLVSAHLAAAQMTLRPRLLQQHLLLAQHLLL
jgi:NAD(P)-dependent dehydrogenase (short-subunit alcohol dehydrogenase family)